MKIAKHSAGLLFFAVTALVPICGSAQTAETSDILRGLPGIQQAPSIGGLETWKMQERDFVWFVAPDGNTVIAGYAFAADGTDLNAGVNGFDEMDFRSFVDLHAYVPDPQEETPQLDFSQIFPSEIPVIDEGDSASGVQPITSFDPSGVNDQVIQSLPENVRNEVLIRLVEALRPVSTEDEFKSVIVAWRAYVRSVAAGGSTGAPFPQITEADIAAAEGARDVPADSGATVLPEPAISGQDPASSSNEDVDQTRQQEVPQPRVEDQESDEASADETPAGDSEFLDDTRANTMWFALGAAEAPVVYAYLDPTCPFCARAMTQISPAIQDGSLQLRVILAPLVSAEAPDVIAGILGSEDPRQAFLDHELATDAGRASPVASRPFSDLGPDFANGIRKNYEMVMEYQIPGVPFFVFDTDEGEKYFSGVPDQGSFSAALPDSFTGSN